MTIYKCIQQSINYVVPPIAITSFSIDTLMQPIYILYYKRYRIQHLFFIRLMSEMDDGKSIWKFIT